MREADRVLREHGLRLASNQVKLLFQLNVFGVSILRF
jgi:hypothetical protein